MTSLLDYWVLVLSDYDNYDSKFLEFHRDIAAIVFKNEGKKTELWLKGSRNFEFYIYTGNLLMPL